MSTDKVKACAEIALDENGEVLWIERYIFKRAHGAGERFVKDSIEYEVLASKISFGFYGGALVEHVCKRVKAPYDNAPTQLFGFPVVVTDAAPKDEIIMGHFPTWQEIAMYGSFEAAIEAQKAEWAKIKLADNTDTNARD